MGIVSILSTIIFVATFLTIFLAIFSYTAYKLRDRKRKKANTPQVPQTLAKDSQQLRVYLLGETQLVGTLRWHDKFGLRLTLEDEREVTVSKNAILYYEEIEPDDAFGRAENALSNEKSCADKRQSPRIKASDSFGLLTDNGSDPIHIEIVDVSGEGIGFIINRKVEPNSIYFMHLSLQPPFDQVLAKVEVIHVGNLPDGRVRVGAKFIKGLLKFNDKKPVSHVDKLRPTNS